MKGIAWAAVERWGAQIIGLLSLLLLARLLKPEAFGLIAMAAVFVAFIEALIDQGMAEAIIQRQVLEPEHLDSAFWLNASMGVILCLVGVASAGLVANMMHEPVLKPVIQLLSITFVFGGLKGVQESLLRRSLAFRSLALRTLVGHGLGGIVAVTMALQGYGVWSLVGLELTRRGAATLVLWWATRWRPGFRVSWPHLREMIPFGLNVMGFRLMNFLNSRGDDLVIGYFLGPVALGFYTVAYQLIRQVERFISGVSTQVAFPAFAKLQHDPEQMRAAFYNVTSFTSLLALPLFLGFSILAPELVNVVFGPPWRQSTEIMQILAFIGLLHVMYSFNNNVLMALGRPDWRLQINIFNAVTNLLVFALAVRWGIRAVAIAYVVRGYVFSPIAILAVRKLIHIDLRTYLRGFAPALKAALVMSAVLLTVKALTQSLAIDSRIMLPVLVLTGMGSYVLGLRLMAPGTLRMIQRSASDMVR